MKKSVILAILTLCLAFISCNRPEAVTGPVVLTGEIIGDCDQVLILAYPQDRFLEYYSVNQEDGRFRFELDDVNGFIDLGVALDEEVYGARINAGDSLHMVFTSLGDGLYDVEYQGRCESESRMFTDFYNTYGYWGQYNIRADRDPDMTMDDSLKLLAENDSAFRAKYGDSLGDYYAHRADMMCTFFKAVFLEEEAYQKGENVNRNPEYIELMKEVDPNDPASIACGLIARWASYKADGMAADERSKPLAFIASPEGRNLSFEARKLMANNYCSTLIYELEGADDEFCYDFFDKMARYLKEDPSSIQEYRQTYENFKNSLSLKTAPDVNLTTPDGTTVPFSSLYGKVIYIDFWASWCGPCLNENPYLVEMAEKLKDDDRVSIVSISVDSDAQAWKDKLSTLQNSWPQYLLDDPAENERLSNALNMQTIPRFVIIKADGTIANIDAPRPSGGDETINAILAAIEE